MINPTKNKPVFFVHVLYYELFISKGLESLPFDLFRKSPALAADEAICITNGHVYKFSPYTKCYLARINNISVEEL